jgi:hypothetical protein
VVFVPSRKDPIHWLSKDLRVRFGGTVRKANLDAGATCPNRDGTLGIGGCAWCDPAGSGPDNAVPGESWQARLTRLAAAALRRGEPGVLAYFQAYTNTHGRTGPALEAVMREALTVPGVLGIAVGTRPDCLPADVLDTLGELNRETFLWVEIGMQTSCDATLTAMNRGHGHRATVRAAGALQARGIRCVLHVILGLPGENEATILASLEEAARLSPWGIKLHPLHVVKGSTLEGVWREGGLDLLSREAYIRLAVDGLERLPPETTIHRLTGERPSDVLLAPGWCLDKRAVLASIQRELSRRTTWQGAKYSEE